MSTKPKKLSAAQRARGQHVALYANFFSGFTQHMIAGFIMVLYANDVLGFSTKKIAAIMAMVPFISIARLFFLHKIRIFGMVKTLRLANVFRAIALLALLFTPARLLSFPLFLTILVLYAAAREIGITSVWQPLLHDVTTNADRGRFYARMRFFVRVFAALSTGLIALFIGQDITELQYKILVAIGLGSISYQHFWIRKLPELRPSPRSDDDPEDLTSWRRFRNVLRSSPLLKRPLLIGVLTVLANVPLGVVYFKQMLHIPANFVTMHVFAVMLSQVCSLLIWGKLADTLGFRPMLIGLHILSILALPLHFLIAPFPVEWAGVLTHRQWLTVGAMFVRAFVVGALLAGTGIGMTSVRHYHVRSKDSLEAINAYAVIVMLATALLTFAGGLYIQDLAIPGGVHSYVRNILYLDWVKGYQIGMGLVANGLILWLLTKLPNTRPYFEVSDFFIALTSNPIRTSFVERQVLHEEEDKRQEAAEWFGKRAGPMAIDPLLELMSDPSYDVKVAAIRSLALTKSDLAGEKLLEMLEDDRKRAVADHVAWALGELQYFPAFDALVSRLKRPPNPDRVRAMAARSLGKLGDPRAIKPLAALLTPEHLAEHQHVTTSACRALLRLEDTSHMNKVLTVLANLTEREEQYEIMDVICGYLSISNEWILRSVSEQKFSDALLGFAAMKPIAWREERRDVLETLKDRDSHRLARLVRKAADHPEYASDRIVQALATTIEQVDHWQRVSVLAAAWLLLREPSAG